MGRDGSRTAPPVAVSSLLRPASAQVVPTIDALRRRREAILAVARRRHASRVRVFGSVARGEASSSSDVDLLVDFDTAASLLDQVGRTQALEALLGMHVT